MTATLANIAAAPAMHFVLETAKALVAAFVTFVMIHLCFWGLEQLPSLMPVHDERALTFIRQFHEWAAVISMSASFTLLEVFAIGGLFTRLRKEARNVVQ